MESFVEWGFLGLFLSSFLGATIIPLSSEWITLQIHSPAVYVSQTINTIKSYGELYGTEWKNDGSMLTFVNIPVSLKSNLCTSLNSLSKGTTQITEVEK